MEVPEIVSVEINDFKVMIDNILTSNKFCFILQRHIQIPPVV